VGELTFQEWRRRHYDVEKDYARRILQTPKGSEERRKLFTLAYSDVIGNIIQAYDPGGGETNDSVMLSALVTSLLASRGPSWRSSKVFDLGCGGGGLLAALAKAGLDVYGVDTSESSVVRAKQGLAAFGKDGQVSNEDFLDYVPPAKFDAIVMDNVIEHIVPDTISDILEKCYANLADGGFLVVITPHLFSGPHDVSKYFLPLCAKAEGFHLREFSFTDLYGSLTEAGFSEIRGCWVHPRLALKFNLVPRPSGFAARKCMALEALAGRWPFRGLFKIHKTISRIIVALAFPAIAVGVKNGLDAGKTGP
jgi:2-polyprenyl-3-methyl-5-hydroxy-6-metoxy-1,4-benzoquinol methylase